MGVLELCLALWRAAGPWAAAVLFLWPLRRRENFGPRLGFGLAVGLAARVLPALLAPQTQQLLWPYFFFGYLLVAGLFALCADIPRKAVFYCAVWSMTLFYLGDSLFLTAAHAIRQMGGGDALAAAAGIAAAAALYLAAGTTLARFMPVDHSYQVGPRQLSSAILLMLLVFLLVDLSRKVWYLRGDWALWAFPLLIEFYCATLLYLQHELFKKSYIQQDLAMLNQLWAQQKAQYALARRNIALINRKCHELKHQIRAMHAVLGSDKAGALDELERSVRIYDAIAKTGNEVLDTVLTEKSLACEENQIQCHCVADGRLLDFMDPVDLYAIFANALDNAIEHVRGIRDPQKRIIDVLVYAEKQLLTIQVINPCTAVPRLGADGLPLSTKPDGSHGYGLKSVRHAVQKYNGFLTVKLEDGCFHLRILLPVKA